MKYKINQSSRYSYFYKIILQTSIIVLVVIFAIKYYKNLNNLSPTFYILTSILAWLVVCGWPLLVLYYNHTKYSKNVSFEKRGDLFVYFNNTDSINFSKDDIQKVELWLTPVAYDKRIDWQYFGKYHFTRIHTKKGQVINISCLVFDKTKEVFPEELIEKRKKKLPLMKPNKIS